MCSLRVLNENCREGDELWRGRHTDVKTFGGWCVGSECTAAGTLASLFRKLTEKGLLSLKVVSIDTIPSSTR
jgi:hypothetical protein